MISTAAAPGPPSSGGTRQGAAMDPIDVLRRFCASWKTGDTDALIEFFTDDATYQNMMDDPWHGKERIHQVFKSFYTFTRSIDFTIRSIAASGNTVLVERIDICTTTENVTAHLPIAGVFAPRRPHRGLARLLRQRAVPPHAAAPAPRPG
jgi:limonene-1,2-epoxide hydrolase